jgi:predicted AAA+ superfamily ATPase
MDAARPQALIWALERGSRSGRVAQQFARDWAARQAEPALVGDDA